MAVGHETEVCAQFSGVLKIGSEAALRGVANKLTSQQDNVAVGVDCTRRHGQPRSNPWGVPAP